MSPLHKTAITSAFLFVMVALGASDAVFTGDTMHLPAIAETSMPVTPPPVQAFGSGTVTQLPSGVAKKQSADVFAILTSMGIVTETTGQESLIRRVIPEDVPVTTRVLLQNEDRIAFFSWTESPQTKAYFLGLKEALHSSFSSQVTDLADTVDERKDRPLRNILTFRDPAIDEERLLFIRVQDRLYELHIAEGKDSEVMALIDALMD